MGAEAAPAVPVAVEQLRRDQPERRTCFIYALMGIGPPAANAVPVLIQMLDKTDDFHTQYWSCRALGRIGLPAAKPAVPKLVRLVRDSAPSVRGNAAAALGNLGAGTGAEAVAVLIAALDDRLDNVRRAAAVALGQFGPAAGNAVPALDNCLAKASFSARSQAAVARYRITQQLEPTVTVLLKELQEPDTPWDAVEGFQQIGAPAAVAVDRLVKLLQSPSSETRQLAASALAAIGPSAKAALSSLKALANDPDPDVREVAAEAIRMIESRK
jgi:HEAT repeat protein